MEEEEEGPLIIREIEIKPVKFSYENMEIEWKILIHMKFKNKIIHRSILSLKVQ